MIIFSIILVFFNCKVLIVKSIKLIWVLVFWGYLLLGRGIFVRLFNINGLDGLGEVFNFIIFIEIFYIFLYYFGKNIKI